MGGVGSWTRLCAFFLACVVLMRVLRELPGVGGLFDSLIGFWVAAIAVSLTVSWASNALIRRRKLESQVRQLGEVGTPYTQGKLGSILLSHGRPRAALEPLRAAAEGEPKVAEWHYRRGMAELALGLPKEATASLRRALAIDEGYAYGDALLRLAEAELAAGDAAASLEALERHERSQGPTPEGCYRFGLALRAAGRGREARERFARVGPCAARLPRFQRRRCAGFVARSWLARALPLG